MKTIHTDNSINRFILHLQISHITLNTFDMHMTTKPFFGLFKHFVKAVRADFKGVVFGKQTFDFSRLVYQRVKARENIH